MNFSKGKPDTFDYELLRTCKNCESVFRGRFCSICGEKIIVPQERSVLAIIKSLVNAFTFFDGRLIRSLVLMLKKPGQLSSDIADGRQVPYLKMLSFFFVANFFYFFFPGVDSFNSKLSTQMHLMGYNEHATRMVNEKLAEEGITLEEFTARYEEQSTNQAKLLIIILVILFACVLAVVNARWIPHFLAMTRYRIRTYFIKKEIPSPDPYTGEYYFFDHFLLSLEFFTFLILVIVIMPVLLVAIAKTGAGLGRNWNPIFEDRYATAVTVIFLSYFLYRSQISFYHHHKVGAVLRTAVMIYALLYALITYRALLFHVTMWTV